MTKTAPLYLMNCYDDIFPEDNKYIELTAAEYAILVAEGREFGPDDFRLPEGEETELQHLVTDIVDYRDEADRRPSEIAAATRAGTVLTCRMNI